MRRATKNSSNDGLDPYVRQGIAMYGREDWTTSVITRHKDGTITIQIKKKRI